MIELRDYQSDLEKQTGAALRRVQSVMLQCPPGGGKTAIATSICSKFAGRRDVAWFICHRRELVEQTSKTFHKHGLAHGIIASGYSIALNVLVQVCSIDTLKMQLSKLAPPRVALIDEAHHSGAAGWLLVIKWLIEGGTKIIGLSGTPRRHDGAGLSQAFDELVLGPTVAWLMDRQFLSQYEIWAPHKPDMRGVKKLMGDYAKKDASEKMRKPGLTGDMVTHWREKANGFLTVGFGVNVAHSMYLAEEFRAAGIRAVHIDGGTHKSERRDMIKDFGPGGIEVIFNVGLFGEGFDLSAIAQRDITIDAVIDAAPTMSLPWNIQKHMRCMRPNNGLVKIILDHAGNSDRHGYPEDEHEWSLDGKQKSASDDAGGPPPPYTCKCFRQIRRPLPECCPSCGKRILAEVKPPEVSEGELKKRTEADKKETRARLKQEEKDCKDIGALVRLGMQRGHKMPISWAEHRMAERNTWRK